MVRLFWSTPERSIEARVRRLAFVSMVALGVIWWLARDAGFAPWQSEVALAAGWALMPAILAASLRLPSVRVALVLPATLVTAALAGISVEASHGESSAMLGWTSLLTGILLGDVLGLWLWFGLMPVPHSLRDPGSAWRWLLVAVHVGFVVGGVLVLAAEALVKR